MFFLRNLSSSQIHTGIAPWEFQPEEPIPDIVRKDKAARDAWINAPSTKHCVYTLHQGSVPNARISAPRTDGEGNPIHSSFGLVADYDAPMPEDAVLKLARKLPYPPNWIEKTLSGNWRYVWLFEEPVVWPSHDFARHFFKRFSSFAFDPGAGSAGFDRGAWEAIERLWTNSCDWRKVQDAPIPSIIAHGWLIKASESFKFDGKEMGPTIPLEVVATELEKRFPRFAEWPGEFTLASQGPTFWVDASTSPKSAIVRETGMQTFSAHAVKGFYSWRDLLGDAFVKDYEARSAAEAVEGIYWDGKQYWFANGSGHWRGHEKADLALMLKVRRGVSNKPDKSGVSAIERAIQHIHEHQYIEGAAPFVFQPTGIIVRHGLRFLNISTRRVLQPAPEPCGPERFPLLDRYFAGLMRNDEQSLWLRGWIYVGYEGAYFLRPIPGQVLFLAGPANVGKTLLNRGILGRIFGGFAEPHSFVSGTDSFNSELFDVGFWPIDDGSTSSDPRKARYMWEQFKRFSAQNTFRCNEKFRKASLVEWAGRVCVTCNADPESIRQIPDLSISNRDKVILLRTAEKPPIEFPPRHELDEILDRELPFFLRHLLDWKMPDAIRGDSRFILKPYADPTLVEVSHQSSPTAGFAEILADWKEDYFNVRNPKAEYWEGSAAKLVKDILLDPTAGPLMRPFTIDAVGRHLVQLQLKGAPLEIIEDNNSQTRTWRIYRNNKPTKT